ncbi:hypothetical protein BCV69DRAFT_288207 [Microstroma glucosiphilum]|uniref:dolichol kinase n=1 Tax=Pseudomicrostroma glucosiphilum TaxID=1684307 RepID=A0A316U135_9BASI|nr:hypothetical protein BCV69DRAFT_288207 [Pseudomicrostroma glucosiphilum]PWN19007.1 hypothetical protein BCV69DRAFT_288207 [Pseudomicrostroma glucosiphilum]
MLAHGNSFIWSTDARSFRASADDGALCGLLLGPLLATTMLISALEEDGSTDESGSYLPNGPALTNPPWIVEGPVPILQGQAVSSAAASMSALSLSRCTLLSLQTMISMIFLSHLCATRWARQWPQRTLQSNWQRLRSYSGASVVIIGLLWILREAFGHFGVPLWTGLARWEMISASILFQASMYAISRLGRRSFTLGELGIVAALGVTLMIEAMNLTLAKLLPHTTPYVKSFRRATPLLIFQLALIVGTFFVGFLLSPLLYLSRHLAQKPLHRLRWPHKRDLHRRLLAGFFYFFAALFVAGALGLWVRWLLGQRDPWLWTIRFIVLGKHWWTRPLLIAYWLACITGSIAGWQAVVSRAKKFRAASSAIGKPFTTQPQISVPPNSANSTPAVTHSAARDGALIKSKKTTHLSLNARRKFFHALAVIMYVPAIAIDPAFTHLAFSLAFSVFTFAEYIRYYALYPFGASFHIFMSEFTDHKDSGPVILSHFYLLTGCCGGLWLEAHKQIMHQTGVLILGIGDALASIVGRRYGRLHWPASSKTIEGSAAFLSSVVFSAWFLRVIGWCQDFSLLRYTGVVSILCLIEGVSEQNDNLILPIFGFIYLSLAHV